MRNICLIFTVLFGVMKVPRAEAQLSTDAPILLEILSNNISQLYQMYEMVQTARDRLRLMQDLSQGLDTALDLYQRMNPPSDPGLYRNWRSIGESLSQLSMIYGQVAATKEAAVQKDIDLGVAEAISLNNKIYEFTAHSDKIGQQIQSRSNATNSKGAQRLTAQSIGVLLEAQNQATRTQATQLKLSAQALALENRKDKEYARRVSEDTGVLSTALKNSQTSFTTPRF